ncbi:MAG: efflux RND transporter periplasmic adaptor subunit [Sphingomicrobium sp.]
MSLVELKVAKEGGAVSGGAMDRIVERKRIDKRLLIAGAAGAVLLLVLLFWLFAPRGDSQSVNPERLTIAEVQQGTFEDFLPLRGRVTPLLTVYLDAVEGGQVEELAVEDGATVVKGQLLAILSNADLQLSTLARQTEVEQQLNNMRSQELALQQTRSSNRRELNQALTDLSKARRLYELQRPLAEKGFVSAKMFNDTKDDLDYQQKRLAILQRSIAEDEQLQSSQLAQLRASTTSLNQSLSIARGSLSQLQLRAPVSGQLSGFSIQLGQSLEPGERLGQIDSAGRSKLEADVDEFYLGRVAVGQTGSVESDGKTYGLKVAKVYPQVRNGQFKIDLVFDGPEPPSIQRGQTMQTKLTLGDSARAVLLPNGAFFNDTGGNWVFVVDESGKSATKRAVRLGRRNTNFIEVLDGLKPGERVITSSYSGLVDKDHLSFDADE